MGLFSKHKPKIKVQSTKKDGFSGWLKCSCCSELIHAKELEVNLYLCPKCEYHYRFPLAKRIQLLADEGTFKELFTEIVPKDSLSFVDTESYQLRLEKSQEKTKRKDAICTGVCRLQEKKTALAVLDFSFMGGSMGSVVGEKLTRLIEYALEKKLPLVVVSASGGARMQESILSLMQMAKTSAALRKMHEKRLPFISVLTNPTTGGVTASFASLGDIIIAEPDALIGFAGPRVLEQTLKQKLPPKVQKSEFLLEKGMIDCIVKRGDLKKKIAFFLSYLSSEKKDLLENSQKRLKLLLDYASSEYSST